MTSKVKTAFRRYAVTFSIIGLTIAVTIALFGLQANSNNDVKNALAAAQAAQTNADAEALKSCHSTADNNQAVRDILFLLSVDSSVTPGMTPSQIESVRLANERRKGYRLIATTLFPLPACLDGYIATSKQEELKPLLDTPPGSTTTTAPQGGN